MLTERHGPTKSLLCFYIRVVWGHGPKQMAWEIHMESYMAKVDYVGLWVCKINFGGVYLEAQRSGQQDGIFCSPWQAQKIRTFLFNFFERGKLETSFDGCSTTKLLPYCPSNHEVLLWCIFPVWPKSSVSCLWQHKLNFHLLMLAGPLWIGPPPKQIDPNFGQSQNQYLYRYSNLSLWLFLCRLLHD